jgi:hypothetical protein
MLLLVEDLIYVFNVLLLVEDLLFSLQVGTAY